MPTIVYEIIDLIAQLLRFLGLAVFAIAFGWLALDLLKKAVAWQFQAVVYLGMIGLVIAMTVYLGTGSMAAFAAGLGVAILIWGLPKKEKKEVK